MALGRTQAALGPFLIVCAIQDPNFTVRRALGLMDSIQARENDHDIV